MRSPLKLQHSLIPITAALNIYAFATSMVGVFIPFVILQHGQNLWEIPAFYLVYSVIKLGLNFPAARLIRCHGARLGLGISFVAGGLQMLTIVGFAKDGSLALLFAGAAALAVANAFAWNAQHLLISQMAEAHSRSSSLATMTIIGLGSNVVAPLVGGFIGAVAGTSWLFAVAAGLSLVALWPLRRINELAGPSMEPQLRYSFVGAPARDLLANYSFNIETVVGTMVWPIYLAVYITSYKAIGAITAVSAAVTMAVTWIAGRRGDRGHNRRVLREGVAVSSVIDILRIFVSSAFWITIVGSTYRASLAYFQNAWTTTYYHHAGEKGLQYIVSMEIACDLAYVTLWGLLLIVLLVSSSSVFFTTAFIIAAIAAWGCLLVTPSGQLEAA